MANDKYIKLMWDHCSNGIWDRDGIHSDYEDFELSKQLAMEIKRWNKACESYADFSIDNHIEIPVSNDLAYWGRMIAKKIKSQKPDWTIVYFDESKMNLKDANQNRTEYEYEIEL